MQVFRRPLVDVGQVQDPTAETVWDDFHALILEAQGEGAPARRVRISPDLTPLIMGSASGAFAGDPPRMIAQAGMDRGGFEVWEDLSLSPSTAIVE